MIDPDEMKGVIAFDFDGVLAQYDGWKGIDILGEPIQETIQALRKLKEEGYKILIFTSRAETPKLRQWLKDNNVPYDAINKNVSDIFPKNAKCFYHCFVDDRALHFNYYDARWDTETLLKAIKRIVNTAKQGKN